MSAAPRRKLPTSSGLTLTPNVEPIRTAPTESANAPDVVVDKAPVPDEHPTLKSVPAAEESVPVEEEPAKEPQRRRAARPKPDEGTKGPEDRVRASNVHVPTSMVDVIEAAKAKSGLTTGELILVAIEDIAAKGKLEDLIHPGKTVGGSLFAARPSNRAASQEAGHKTPVNYRLREGDFVVLDNLVTQYKAPSRNHLIVAALKGYLG